MSVHQLKDGRWIVQYRILGTKKYKREYFGRGLQGEYKARDRQNEIDKARYNLKTKKEGIPAPREKRICERLVKEFKADFANKKIKTEVKTKAGMIDIVTPEEIIEVKEVRGWKNALGQILAHNIYMPDKNMRIHLFGRIPTGKKDVICSVCDKFNVSVSIE